MPGGVHAALVASANKHPRGSSHTHCPRSPTALVAEPIAVTRPIRREASEADAIVAEATAFAVDAALAAEANAFAAEASAANSLVVEAMLPSWRKCDRMWPAHCDRMWPALGQ